MWDLFLKDLIVKNSFTESCLHIILTADKVSMAQKWLDQIPSLEIHPENLNTLIRVAELELTPKNERIVRQILLDLGVKEEFRTSFLNNCLKWNSCNGLTREHWTPWQILTSWIESGYFQIREAYNQAFFNLLKSSIGETVLAYLDMRASKGDVFVTEVLNNIDFYAPELLRLGKASEIKPLVVALWSESQDVALISIEERTKRLSEYPLTVAEPV